jgi:hypothetical protein
MKRNGTLLRLVQFLKNAMLASFFAVAWSGLCIISKWDLETDIRTGLFSIWIFSISLAGLTTFRAVYVFCIFLEEESKPS